MPVAFSPWDLALLAVVTAMGTLLAYLSDPRWKAFLLSLPFPFTLANLSLGEPIGPSHALGLWSLLLFVHLVRWLHYGLRLPILAAIALPAPKRSVKRVTSCSAKPAFRSAITTLAPWPSNSSAKPRPKPWAEPVTRAIFSISRRSVNSV